MDVDYHRLRSLRGTWLSLIPAGTIAAFRTRSTVWDLAN
jgi:hypothetical protein